MCLRPGGACALILLLSIPACTSDPGPGHGDAVAPAAESSTLPMYPVPPGFDYPQPAATIEGWVSQRQGPRIREHGWYLWAAVNTNGTDGAPIWRSWPTSTQAFAPAGPAAPGDVGLVAHGGARVAGLRALNRANAAPATPINLPAPYYKVPDEIAHLYGIKDDLVHDGATMQFNGDIMVAGVIYDRNAFEWIRSRGLHSAATLTSLQKSGAKSVAGFPAGSIVLKAMLWPVRQDGFTALPVWDDLPPDADDGKYVGYEIKSKWTRAVALTPPTASQLAVVPVTYLHGVYENDRRTPLGPLTYSSAPVVPITQLYHRRIEAAELAAMDKWDRAILDCSAWWCFGRRFQAGDYLVTVAMHIVTAEQPAWTLQTFWWHDQPERSEYSKDQPDIPPSQAPGPWRHYLQSSTYGMTTVEDPTRWPVAYNPYIELAAAHPIATNCRNCHLRAAWPPERVGAAVHSSYLKHGPGLPDALQVFDATSPVFNGLMRLDFQWAVSDRAQ